MEKPLPPDTSLHIPVSNGYIIALLACSGLYTWEVIQSLPIDWKMVKGRRGCRWGAAIFYFPLRIVALVHFACSMSLLFPPPWQPEGVVDVRYTRESTAMISRTCTYHIIMLYIASLWHFRTLSWALFALILALWIVNAYGISRMQTSWFLSTMPGVISCTLIFLSTLLFALFVGGILRMRSQPHLVPQSRRTRYAKTPVWYMLWKEKLHLIVLIWAAQIVTSVAGLSRFNSVAWSIADITCYTIIVSCGGRVYQHSIRRGSQCPTLSYYWCPVSSAVRAGLSQKHRVNIEMDTFVAGVSRAGAQPQHQPRRQEQTPTLRVVTLDLHARSDPIEMTTYPLSCSEADSASSISASQKMLSTQAMIHSGPSSSTTIFPPDAASFSSRIAKAPSWAGSRDMQDRGGAG